jgi:hypothetical protein
MAKWKKIATVNDDGNLTYATTGAALSVNIDTSLGNGGTGQDLSSADNSIIYTKDGAMHTLAAPTSGTNQILAWTANSADPHWQDVTAIEHNHDGQYLDLETTAPQDINGFVTFNGALNVNGTVSFASTNASIITSGLISITTADTGAPATDFNNKGLTIDDGDATTDNPGIFWSTTASRWGVGSAGSYQHPLMLCDFTINPTNGATATTDYADAIGTVAFSSDGSDVFIVTSA